MSPVELAQTVFQIKDYRAPKAVSIIDSSNNFPVLTFVCVAASWVNSAVMSESFSIISSRTISEGTLYSYPKFYNTFSSLRKEGHSTCADACC